MRIAYFVNQYPMVSHSFIRREIMALEELGCDIFRIALRSSPQSLVDQHDKAELVKTRHILQESVFTFIRAIFGSLITSPNHFFSAFVLAMKTGWNSERGVVRHIIYFAEACVLAMWLKAEMVQHVHAHFGTNSTTVVMIANELCSIPYSFTVHGPEEFDKPVALSLRQKIKRSSFVVAISSYGKGQLSRWVTYDLWHKINVVHCGLDRNFYSGEIEPIGKTHKFVCVGRLCEQKGQPLLLKALSILSEEGREFELVLAGDGHLRPELEALIQEFDLQDKVRITGWISSKQVREELLDSRALVLPSFAEGLPVVIMEAMSLARPVISTYVAGIPELVQSGENGWLVAAGDVGALADALREALTTEQSVLNEMGRKARQRVIERHDINTEAGKLLSLISNQQ
ncbi:MAG: glycosyltransferase family 4 protein [Hyphomicrobiales bacterium]|nr:glycosyltransferase family 4 protein [Hyphomicrobiales bacterium]